VYTDRFFGGGERFEIPVGLEHLISAGDGCLIRGRRCGCWEWGVAECRDLGTLWPFYRTPLALVTELGRVGIMGVRFALIVNDDRSGVNTNACVSKSSTSGLSLHRVCQIWLDFALGECELVFPGFEVGTVWGIGPTGDIVCQQIISPALHGTGECGP
jgi:hypothetical protein